MKYTLTKHNRLVTVVDCPERKAVTQVSYCLKKCNMLHQVRMEYGEAVVECGKFENRVLKTECLLNEKP